MIRKMAPSTYFIRLCMILKEQAVSETWRLRLRLDTSPTENTRCCGANGPSRSSASPFWSLFRVLYELVFDSETEYCRVPITVKG